MSEPRRFQECLRSADCPKCRRRKQQNFEVLIRNKSSFNMCELNQSKQFVHLLPPEVSQVNLTSCLLSGRSLVTTTSVESS